MSDENVSRIHWSFWVIGAFALIWNAMGSMNYLMQVTADSLASYPDAARAIIEGRPGWATGGFSIGVFVGALGSVLLLLRKSAAYYLFVVSLLGVFVTMIHTVQVGISKYTFSAMEILIMILMPVVVAVFLVWYSKKAQSKRWIS